MRMDVLFSMFGVLVVIVSFLAVMMSDGVVCASCLMSPLCC